jgi:hypothetical protein
MTRNRRAVWIGSVVLSLYALLPLRTCGNEPSAANAHLGPSPDSDADIGISTAATSHSAPSGRHVLRAAPARTPNRAPPPRPATAPNVAAPDVAEWARVRATLRVDLERRLTSEHFDAQRSAELRHYLDGAVSDLGTTITVRDVACHETLCRVDLHLADPDDGSQLYELAVDQEQQREIFFEGAEGGGLSVVSYVFHRQRHADADE